MTTEAEAHARILTEIGNIKGQIGRLQGTFETVETLLSRGQERFSGIEDRLRTVEQESSRRAGRAGLIGTVVGGSVVGTIVTAIRQVFPAVAGVGIVLWAFPAAAAVCGPRTEIVSRLLAGHAEIAVSMALGTDGNIYETYASDERTWTLVVTRPTGLACVIATGNGYEFIPTQLDDRGL